MDRAPLTILGATGYTGRLCAAEAVRRGRAVRLAGRRRDALDALARELGGDVDVAAADVGDTAALAALAGATDVLLSTVGPYERLGRPVVEAALAEGCDYLDVSGELEFLDWVHRQGGRAEAAGVVLVPGAGFDGVPGDLLAALCAAEHDGEVHSVRAAYLLRGGRPSAGTARSALGVVANGGAAWLDGAMRAEPVAADAWDIPFPEPLGVRTGVSVPLPEVVTAGRTTTARTARTYVVVPSLPAIRPAAEGVARLGGLLASTPLWDLLHRAVDGLPEGPSPGERARARAAVLVEVAGPGGRTRAWARLTDMYTTTAVFAVAFADRLADPARRPAPGARTPAQAAGGEPAAIADFLRAAGVRWDRL
jgi:short subunit dehydrogenase-like uncharacterized protein